MVDVAFSALDAVSPSGASNLVWPLWGCCLIQLLLCIGNIDESSPVVILTCQITGSQVTFAVLVEGH